MLILTKFRQYLVRNKFLFKSDCGMIKDLHVKQNKNEGLKLNINDRSYFKPDIFGLQDMSYNTAWKDGRLIKSNETPNPLRKAGTMLKISLGMKLVDDHMHQISAWLCRAYWKKGTDKMLSNLLWIHYHLNLFGGMMILQKTNTFLMSIWWEQGSNIHNNFSWWRWNP